MLGENEVLASLEAHGFSITTDTKIDDRYYDTADKSLSLSDFVMRLRLDNGTASLAEKGPRFCRANGEYDRVELALPIHDVGAFEAAIAKKALRTSWRLERRRRTFRAKGNACEVVIDSLAKVGTFLEMEGPSSSLESLSESLRGLGRQETRNYHELILDWCTAAGMEGHEIYGLDSNGVLTRTGD